ncbi:DMT family transporter [Pannonibacter sp. SL95]|uniref:DMT family transporter n=1 Tax=Pannonibacter sp. SL95 TaxID=2995153 RepID=UPI002275E4C4|nr:DMT family transporter [Pannonibacter sp. SL95]MCY1706293.1 DMT family transporter [Pannonibacter sp. SL95]
MTPLPRPWTVTASVSGGPTFSVPQAYVVLAAGGICLGLAPVVVKALPLPADVSAFYRVAMAAPIFTALMLVTEAGGGGASQVHGQPRQAAGRPALWLYALAAGLFAADLLAMHAAIRLTNASVATLFTNCAPFFIGVFGLLGLSDRPGANFWWSLPVALSGTVLLVGLSVVSGGGSVAGDAIALLAGLLYGAYLVTVRRLKQAGASTLQIMVAVTAGSTVCLAPTLLWQEQIVPPDARSIGLLVVLVLVGQVLGQGLVTVALKTLPVTSSSIVLLIQPIVAAPLAYLLLGEALSPAQILGIALVLASIWIATRPPRRSV